MIRPCIERLNVDRIVRNILTCRHWLTVSCRGVEDEVTGQVVGIRRTVRGLTLVLDTGKLVVAKCPKSVAMDVQWRGNTALVARRIS